MISGATWAQESGTAEDSEDPRAAKPADDRGKARQTRAALRLEKLSHSCYAAVQAGGKSNAGVVVGEQAVLVIDCLGAPAQAGALIAEVAKKTDKPVRFVAFTHSHYDHTVGSQAMPAKARVLASSAAAKYLASRLEKDRMLLAPAAGGMHGSLRIGSIRRPDVVVPNGHEIDLGGVEVRLLVVGDSHSPGDLVAWVPSEKVLFAGDLVWNRYHPNLVGGATFRWIGTLAKLETLDIEKVVPGHGGVGSKALLAKQRHYLMDLRRLVKHLARKKVPVQKIMEGLDIPEVYREFGHAAWWPKNVRFVHGELIRNR